MTSRREFLATLSASLGVLSTGDSLLPAFFAPRDRLDRIGIQLYTVRALMGKDFEGTLASIARIGYNEVEFAGYFNRTPAQVREVLAANKLTAPSTHIGFPKDDAAWKGTLDQATAMGHQWVVIASIDGRMTRTLDDWKRVADRFNQLGAMARSAGLRFGYHNHTSELAPLEGANALETLLKGTDPAAVGFEMDIYWVVKGGGDPLDLIARYPNRFQMFHAKDATPAPALAMVDVGAGTIDFGAIFAKAKPQHVFVEHDQPTDALKSAAVSYQALKNLTF